MKKHLIVVECAIEHDGKFLIIKRPEGKHAGGLLSFPGGKLEEKDELNNHRDILRAVAIREVAEEVGLKLEDPLQYITSTYFTDKDGTPVIDSIFHCVLNKTSPEVVASEAEVPEYYWMDKDEINDNENSPEWLKQYMQLIG